MNIDGKIIWQQAAGDDAPSVFEAHLERQDEDT